MGIPQALDLQPHTGLHELIIGIDVGTTFSGVCYAFLRPGEIPEIQSVTSFTDQTTGDSKIPSIMYYDKDGKLKAAGATAVSENAVYDAVSENWTKVEYFKLHLRPSSMVINTHGLDLSTLPSMKTAVDVMGDFLHYMYSETIGYIKNRHTDSSDLLHKVEGRIKFVLSHPNGWDGLQQQRMREAAVRGGLLIGHDDALSKIKFVSEGEASALSCLASGFCPPTLEKGFRFMIADLGGGTLDMTSYEVTQSSPLHLKELTSSDCRFAGSIFVNIRARKLLRKLLRGSQYDNSDVLDELINDHFENSTKRQFRDASKASWLRIANRDETNTRLGIRQGRLRIDGKDMAECFDHSVSEALKSIKDQITRCGGSPMPVWLVGGFASSDYIFDKLGKVLGRDGIDVRRPSSIDLAKAVSHGNVLYSLGTTVSSRVTRNTYGIICSRLYNDFNPEHRRLKHLQFTNLSGKVMLPGNFDVIVKKNKEVQETRRFSRSYSREIRSVETAIISVNLWSFANDGPVPTWYEENIDKFKRTCTIKADLSKLCFSLSLLESHDGELFWKIDCDVEIMFGLTELQARIKWVENGETKYGPATIFYDEE